jgi:hypothetical protein
MAEVDLRYPTGRFAQPAAYTPAFREQAIDTIAKTPAALRKAVAGLSDAQLDTPYRPDGWSVRQVVHHVPDSHLNAYVRVKLALTEDRPTIKPYDEHLWAQLEDTRSTPIETSLTFLESLHERWVRLFRSLGDDDFGRRYVHPETGEHHLDYLIALYAWHGPHHVAHVTSLRHRMGWES